MDTLIVLVLALAIDLIVGDPPTLIHPVGWMGKMISLMEKLSPKKSINAQFLYGTGMVLIGIAVFAVSTYFLLEYLDELHRIAYIVVGALMLKSAFTISGLRRSALRVKKHLIEKDLKGAQSQIGSLVSRETENLTEPLTVAATVESTPPDNAQIALPFLTWFLILWTVSSIKLVGVQFPVQPHMLYRKL